MNPQNNIPQANQSPQNQGAMNGQNFPQPAQAPFVQPQSAVTINPSLAATRPAMPPSPTPQPILQPIPQPVQQTIPTQPQFSQSAPAAAPTPQPQSLQASMTNQQFMPNATQPTITQPQASAPAPALPAVAENPISTQSTLLISELRDGVVIMKDGSFRAVVACQSINFDLMSEQEREGVEYSYQNFLNSLSFTVQILVRSQRVDIGPYIERLIKMRRNNDNMLLGVLMDDYINFIDILSQEANIMDKAFFIVIPYYLSADAEKVVEQTKNLFKTFGKNKAPNVTRISRDDYDKAVDELNKRVDSVTSGLFQIGIQSARLNTKELSELYYNFNNPDTAVREPLVDFSKLATTYVRKGDR